MGTNIINHQSENKDTATRPISEERSSVVVQDTDLNTSEPLVIQIATVALSVITIVMTLRYITWRLSVTQWHLWWLSIPLLTAELFTAFHILGYQYTIWPRRTRSLNLTVDIQHLPVYVFIPTVNEGVTILEPTIKGAVIARDRYLARHPEGQIKIIICNDGLVANVPDWKSVETLAAAFGVECITRTVPGGAKAGNIENARLYYGATGQCLLAVLDADQVAEPDFFLRAVAPFGDRSIGWVQTRQHYRNDDCTVSRWAEHQASLFYDLVCPGKSAINSSYICGTNVIIRAQVLDEIGGFPTESVTEDFAASIRTHQSWRSIYIKDVLAQGVGPLDITGYFVQQSRWARGTVGVLRSDWQRLLLPARLGLSFDQRLQYLLSGTHYLCGLRDLIFLSTALTSLYLSDSPILPVSLKTIALYLLPYIAASQLLILLQVRSLSILSGAVIGYISFPVLVTSCFEAFLNKRMKFMVTPKLSSGHSDLRAILPHITIFSIAAAVLIHAFATGRAITRIDLVPLIWVVYAMCLIFPTFFLAKFRTVRR